MPEETGVQVALSRDSAYGEAWALTGKVLAPINVEVQSLLKFHPHMFFPFIMIVNKLIRILASPDNPDHWLDIAGYAELVLRDMKSKTQK